MNSTIHFHLHFLFQASFLFRLNKGNLPFDVRTFPTNSFSHFYLIISHKKATGIDGLRLGSSPCMLLRNQSSRNARQSRNRIRNSPLKVRVFPIVIGNKHQLSSCFCCVHRAKVYTAVKKKS